MGADWTPNARVRLGTKIQKLQYYQKSAIFYSSSLYVCLFVFNLNSPSVLIALLFISVLTCFFEPYDKKMLPVVS